MIQPLTCASYAHRHQQGDNLTNTYRDYKE